MSLTSDVRGVRTPCPSCGQINRLRFESLTKETRCGRCQTPLTAPGSPVAVTDVASFDAMVATSALPVVVDFWAQWCGPCRAMAPEFDKVARSMAGKWLVVKVDTDKVPELSERFRIMSIPTLAVFKDGQERARRSGAMGAPDIERFMNQAG